MYRVDIPYPDGEQLAVVFHHIFKRKRDGSVRRRRTECSLYIIAPGEKLTEESTTIATGSSFQYTGSRLTLPDVYDKGAGRRLALTRALNAAFPSVEADTGLPDLVHKAIRMAAWEGYALHTKDKEMQKLRDSLTAQPTDQAAGTAP